MTEGAPSSSRNRRMLDSGWTFRQADGDVWLPAQVPGSNFTDLWRAGLIEDPYRGDAETRLGWIEQTDWDYRCTFEVAAGDLAADSVELAFDGLDTFCEVRLNGVPLLLADNMFRTHAIEVRNRLRPGANELTMRFRSPVQLGAERRAEAGFEYPAENDKTPPRASVYARKAPYQFGWDWGPKYVTSGVWRPVWLDVARRARIRDANYRIERLDDARAEVSFAVEVEVLTGGACAIELVCDEPGVAPVRQPITLAVGAGPQVHHVRVSIDAPRRWWPNGLGEAFLYGFSIRLTDADSVIDATTLRVGLRSVIVRNEPDEFGESFLVEVNGRPTFMKGANYIPPDSFPERMTPERYGRVFRDAVDANMNMLRVWGGGVYESDLFYDLADEHGILIWQDFMFSCTLYPGDPAFLDNVAREAADNIRRLRRHPSLALWCGNNEIAMGIADWDWPEKFGYSPAQFDALVADYRTIFEQVLPDAVARHDPERFYMASSPIGFWNDPGDDARGDSHYWGVWHGELPFESYADRVPRFMSEYGFQSYPIASSIERFTAPADRAVGSSVLAVHQKHGRGDAIIGRFVRELYGEPADFASFCYLSQLAQADGLRIAFEAHRRSMPYCMGSLYWQFNDCWPAISWSSIDYYGQWKALHYQAARSFAPLLISAEPREGGFVVHLVSDRVDAIEGLLSIRLIDFAGECRWREAVPVGVAGNVARVVHHIYADSIRGAGDPAELVMEIVVTLGDGTIAARDIRMLCDPVRANLPDPGLVVAVDNGRAIVRAERFARAVQLTTAADGDVRPAANFTDNFFDLLPGEERVVALRADVLTGCDGVEVRSLWNACCRSERAVPARLAGSQS